MAPTLLETIKLDGRVPEHIAVIMDGNGRWARERGLPRYRGHLEGMKSVREVIEGAIEAGVRILTLFAFSVTQTVQGVTYAGLFGCVAPRQSCNPTVGGEQASAFVRLTPGLNQSLLYFVPIRGGNSVTFDLNPAVTAEDVANAGAPVDLDRVHVVPNPYIMTSEFERATENRVLKFTHLPPQGTITIYDVAGRFVQQLTYGPGDLQGGDLNWNLQTHEGLALGYGLYIYVLESELGNKTGKFVVIR